MDLEAAKFWMDIVQFLVMGIIGFYVHIMARQRVTEKELAEHKDDVTGQLNGLGQRLSRVEEAGRHAPTHDHLGDVYEKIDTVSGHVHEIVGKLDGMGTQLRLINEHLMKVSR